MKTNILVVLILSALSVMEGNSQIKSILDSKFNKFSIGFDISIQSNQETKVQIYNENKIDNYVIFDSTLTNDEHIFFIFSNYIEQEKNNFVDKKIIQIPEMPSGSYYIEIYTKQKFILVK